MRRCFDPPSAIDSPRARSVGELDDEDAVLRTADQMTTHLAVHVILSRAPLIARSAHDREQA